MQPWTVMGYYPPSHESEAFLEHLPHYLLFMCVVMIMAACGWGIADVLEARPSRQYLGIAIGSFVGLLVGSFLFLG